MESICDLIWQAGQPRAALAARLGIHEDTLCRYMRTNSAPPPVRALLEVYAGRVPWPGGERLVCVRGVLYPQDSDAGIALADVPAVAWRLRELDALRREVDRYRRAPAQYLLDLSAAS